MWQNVPGTFNAQAFYTPLIDLTATPASYTLIPSMPGFLFGSIAARLFNVKSAGTISTSVTLKAGNDGSNVNMMASQTPATTAFSSATPAPGYGAALSAVAAPTTLIDLATPVTLVIVTAAVGTDGTFRWSGRIAILGSIVPNS